jgi:hypothetical protein
MADSSAECMAPGPPWWTLRPRRSGAQRRAQKLRQQGRAIQHLLKAFGEITKHRGGELSQLGLAVNLALQTSCGVHGEFEKPDNVSVPESCGDVWVEQFAEFVPPEQWEVAEVLSTTVYPDALATDGELAVPFTAGNDYGMNVEQEAEFEVECVSCERVYPMDQGCGRDFEFCSSSCVWRRCDGCDSVTVPMVFGKDHTHFCSRDCFDRFQPD